MCRWCVPWLLVCVHCKPELCLWMRLILSISSFWYGSALYKGLILNLLMSMEWIWLGFTRDLLHWLWWAVDQTPSKPQSHPNAADNSQINDHHVYCNFTKQSSSLTCTWVNEEWCHWFQWGYTQDKCGPVSVFTEHTVQKYLCFFILIFPELSYHLRSWVDFTSTSWVLVPSYVSFETTDI